MWPSKNHTRQYTDRSVEMNLVDTINFLHVYKEVDGGSITPFNGGPHTLYFD
jgi:hypothetical protein